MCGPCARQNPEPAKRVNAFKFAALARWDRFATNAMKTIATRDIRTFNPLSFAIQRIRYFGRGTIQALNHHVLHPVEDCRAHTVLRVIEICRDFGLAIDHDLLAGQVGKVDVHHQIIVCEIASIMHNPFHVHSRGQTGLTQHFDRAAFQQACADTRKHMRSAGALQHDC